MSAEELDAELAKILAETGHDHLHDDDVWKYAKDHPESPLHGEFEWDVREAAKRHWRDMSRKLIRAVQYVTVIDGEERIVAKYDSISAVYVTGINPQEYGRGKQHRVYVEAVPAMARKPTREILLAQARAEMLAFIAKYDALKDLRDVIRTLKAAIKRLDTGEDAD